MALKLVHYNWRVYLRLCDINTPDLYVAGQCQQHHFGGPKSRFAQIANQDISEDLKEKLRIPPRPSPWPR